MEIKELVIDRSKWTGTTGEMDLVGYPDLKPTIAKTFPKGFDRDDNREIAVINDKFLMPLPEKERRLTEEFAKRGIALKFVDGEQDLCSNCLNFDGSKVPATTTNDYNVPFCETCAEKAKGDTPEQFTNDLDGGE